MLEDEIKILENKIKLLNETINEFKKNNSIDKLMLKEQLNDFLGQLAVCLKYTIVPKKYSKLISAFKYANNIKKHSLSLFDYTISTLGLYASDNLYPSDNLFPSSFKIWWGKLPLDDKKYANQYNCYNKYLLNKDLLESINDIFDLIKNNCCKCKK